MNSRRPDQLKALAQDWSCGFEYAAKPLAHSVEVPAVSFAPVLEAAISFSFVRSEHFIHGVERYDINGRTLYDRDGSTLAVEDDAEITGLW